MNNWILLVLLSWNNSAVVAPRFPNQESCEQAGRWFDKHAANSKWICLQDITVDIPTPEPEKTPKPPEENQR